MVGTAFKTNVDLFSLQVRCEYEPNLGEGQVSFPPTPTPQKKKNQTRSNNMLGCLRKQTQHLLLPSFTVRSKPERPCAGLPYLNVKEIMCRLILRHSALYDALKVFHCPLKIHLNICLKNLTSCQRRAVELRKPELRCHKRAKCSMLYSYIRQSYCCNNFLKKHRITVTAINHTSLLGKASVCAGELCPGDTCKL